ncbi:MAG TPA: DapH/DapD/GlmU-related protein [Myxococcota bacterium]|nr:DapH/DapD/GlmU-related protein [Myxococcota bacterium]
MNAALLRAIYRWDRLRFALFAARFGQRLRADPSASPNLRFAELRIEPGAVLEVGAGFAAERRRGNFVWIQSGGLVSLGPRVWLRTECGENRITAAEGARVELGARCLVNGAMLHANVGIRMGDDSMIGFGSRVLDSDFHDLDVNTPERSAPVRIGERVWIASDVTVLAGVTIGDDVVVGARSLVTRDLPPRVLALGVPAVPVRAIGPRARLPG